MHHSELRASGLLPDGTADPWTTRLDSKSIKKQSAITQYVSTADLKPPIDCENTESVGGVLRIERLTLTPGR